jgi:hypothetical protein
MDTDIISKKIDDLTAKVNTLIDVQKSKTRVLSEWVDNQEALQIFSCSPRKLQTLRHDKILPYSRPFGGSKIFYRRKDVMDLFEKNFSNKS